MTDAFDTIIQALAPYLGAHMSQAVVVGSLEKMKIQRDQATSAEVEHLLRDLGLGLNVFVGRAKGKAILQELHRKLGISIKPAP